MECMGVEWKLRLELLTWTPTYAAWSPVCLIVIVLDQIRFLIREAAREMEVSSLHCRSLSFGSICKICAFQSKFRKYWNLFTFLGETHRCHQGGTWRTIYRINDSVLHVDRVTDYSVFGLNRTQYGTVPYLLISSSGLLTPRLAPATARRKTSEFCPSKLGKQSGQQRRATPRS
jgi:hypothetical protein